MRSVVANNLECDWTLMIKLSLLDVSENLSKIYASKGSDVAK